MKKSSAFVFLFAFSLTVIPAQEEVSVYPQLGHHGEVTAAVYNPVSSLLASCSLGSGDIRIWDIENGKEIKIINMSNTLTYSMIWNKDGTRLICGTFGGYITVVDLKTGNELQSWAGHNSSINSLSLSPDGSNFISASFDRTIKKWDSESGEELFVFSGFESAINQAIYSTDGQKIIVSCDNGTVRIIDAMNGRELLNIPAHEGPVYSAVTSANGIFLASGGFDGMIKLWYAPNGVLLNTIKAHDGPVSAVAFNPDGTRLASCSMDTTVKEWLVSNGEKLSEFSGHKSYVRSVVYNKNGTTLLSASFDNSVKESIDGEELQSYSGYSRAVHASVFSLDGEYLISGYGGNLFNEDTTIRIWSTKTGSLIKTLTGHGKPVSSLDISPDGKKLISGSMDHSVKLWDLEKDSEPVNLEGHSMGVIAVFFSPNGDKAVSCSNDNTFILWDIENGRAIHKFEIKDDILRTVAWSPGGRQIAAGTNRGISIWGTENFELIKKIESVWNVNSIAYSPDGSRFASGHSTDNAAMVYDLETGESVFPLEGHDAPVTAVRFSKDGKLIFTATGGNFNSSGGKSIKVFSSESGELFATLTGHLGGINSIGISADAKRVVSASGDTTVRIWDLEFDEEITSVSWKETAQLVGFMNGEWICVTKEGFYNASPGGADYLNVRIGDKVYGIDQFRETFRKPEVVTALLSDRTTKVNVDLVIENAGQFLPPVIEILSAKSNEGGNSAEFIINIYDENLDIAKIEFFVNENKLGNDVLNAVGNNNDVIVESASLAVKNRRSITLTIPIPLTEESNRVKIRAYNNLGASSEKTEVINGVAQNTRPNLWILAIGISRYEYTRQTTFRSLQYAAKDASEFVNCLLKQEGKVYEKVNFRLINDYAEDPEDLPTRENIMKSLDYLQNGGSRDTVILFISGHGLNDANNNFYLIPRDFNDSIPLSESAISNTDLSNALERAGGNKMAFVDACHSGNIEKTGGRLVDTLRLVSDLRNLRTVVMTASTGAEESYENFLYGGGHGAFTFSLIEGLKGRADSTGRKRITLKALEVFVYDSVTELTDNKQNPEVIYPNGFRGNPVIASLE